MAAFWSSSTAARASRAVFFARGRPFNSTPGCRRGSLAETAACAGGAAEVGGRPRPVIRASAAPAQRRTSSESLAHTSCISALALSRARAASAPASARICTASACARERISAADSSAAATIEATRSLARSAIAPFRGAMNASSRCCRPSICAETRSSWVLIGSDRDCSERSAGVSRGSARLPTLGCPWTRPGSLLRHPARKTR